MQSSIGTSFSSDDIENHLTKAFAKGQVIPGYGHAVLRQADPRFMALLDFASSRPAIGQNPLFQLVQKISEIAPEVLKVYQKVTLFPVGRVCITVCSS